MRESPLKGFESMEWLMESIHAALYVKYVYLKLRAIDFSTRHALWWLRLGAHLVCSLDWVV